MNEHSNGSVGQIDSAWSEQTRGLCPECLRDVPAALYEQDTRIFIEQRCPRHGPHTALIASDSAEYLRLRQYVPPRVGAACCCGPGETCDPGKPPVCILVLEITQACNLACPTCYADAKGHDFMSVSAIRTRLDGFFQQQSALDVLMLSGGEPTIHPAFVEVLDLALTYPVNRVLINTNGLRLAQSQDLARALSDRRKRIELYFSFSSFRPSVHQHLYGKDLISQKISALTIARNAGVFVNIVATVERGVNDDELGDLYRFALTDENISGLVIQPVMNTGRYLHSYAPEQRFTLTDALSHLEAQTDRALRSGDFVGLPCSHPDCSALTYGFLNSDRTQIAPLPRYLDVSRYLDLFADRVSFEGLLGSAARRLWRDLKSGHGVTALRDLVHLFSQPAVRAMLPLIGDPERAGRRIFRIVVKPFMDAHTYDLKRIDQCCTKILDGRGEAVSFCEYNVFHRGRKPQGRAVSLPMVK